MDRETGRICGLVLVAFALWALIVIPWHRTNGAEANAASDLQAQRSDRRQTFSDTNGERERSSSDSNSHSLRTLTLDKEKSDTQILKAVEEQLQRCPFVDCDRITVEVKDSVATLKGTVNSLLQRDMAEANAYQGGARKVRNLLVIKKGSVATE
jgi:osmotically-inducible protein OsmY